MSDQLTQEQIDNIQNALAACRKIEAIKIYREATGQGLKEAKDFVEALIPKLIEQDPQKFAKLASQKTGGCAGVVLLGICLVGALVWIGGSIL